MLPDIFSGAFDSLSFYQLATHCRLHYRDAFGSNYAAIQAGTGRRMQRTEFFTAPNSPAPRTQMIDFADYRLVIVRGSTSTPDWYRNLASVLSAPTGQQGESAAAGWLAAAQAIFAQIFDSNERKEKPTLLLGHSAGGAIATLVGYLLAVDGPGWPFGVVTFGSPMCMNSVAWQRLETKPVFRVVRRGDYVESMPPLGRIYIPGAFPWSTVQGFNNFIHGGSLVFLAGDGGPPRRYEGENRTMRTIMNDILAGGMGLGLWPSSAAYELNAVTQSVARIIAEHHIAWYCRDLRSQVRNAPRGPLAAFDSVNYDLGPLDGQWNTTHPEFAEGFEAYTTVLNEDLYFPPVITAPVTLPEVLPEPSVVVPLPPPPVQLQERIFRRRRNVG